MKTIAAIATMLLCSTFALHATDDAKTKDGQGGMKGRFSMGKGGQSPMREKIRAKMLDMFDANHDGKLEGDEIEQAKAWLQEKRAEFAQKHPEQAGKMAEKMKEHKKSGAAGAQKTAASPDEKQAIQKAMENVNQDPPVKL